MVRISCYVQHKTIESVLERGEKLDSLVDKSAALSASSKSFYKTAKSQVRRSVAFLSRNSKLIRSSLATELLLRWFVPLVPVLVTLIIPTDLFLHQQ
jgi:hypothetical protein